MNGTIPSGVSPQDTTMWQLALVIRFEDVSNRNSLVVAAPGLEDGIGIGDGGGRVGEG